MLYIADELFFTGTAAEITPIRSVDRIPVGTGKPGPLTLAIQKEYMGIARRRTSGRQDRHRLARPMARAITVTACLRVMCRTSVPRSQSCRMQCCRIFR